MFIPSRPAAGLALLAALAAPLSLTAVEATSHPATPQVINSACPMDGKQVVNGTKSVALVTIGEGAEAKQYLVAFCSDACCDEFKKDPGAAISYNNKNIGPKGGDIRKGQ